MPYIESANTMFLSVEGITLTDSSTVLDAVVHYNPGQWVRFDSASSLVADGKHYPIISVDSMTLGEYFWRSSFHDAIPGYSGFGQVD